MRDTVLLLRDLVFVSNCHTKKAGRSFSVCLVVNKGKFPLKEIFEVSDKSGISKDGVSDLLLNKNLLI